MTVEPAVLTELARLRERLPELTGSVLATTDGMVVAHDAHDLDPETLAAMSAASLGLARRFAVAVDHGTLRETVVACAGGYITTYAAGRDALLTVVTGRLANLARVHLEARRTLERLAQIAPSAPTAADPRRSARPSRKDVPGGLARRKPMASLPRNARQKNAG
ncbi:roadblock/LC7 domain-containing protein [Pilimelia terevasa]|uniref:roadblock/LC7 domain-containing protein n=1 Tax=Pilimelia terevasa TaxID=53372 RepID=UPI0016664034|nr:roadblock/LC7 domain-containing protein [Pilimelia terevasa]